MSSFKHLSVNQLVQMTESKPVQIVDIRDGNSFNNGHIAGAVNLNNDNLAQFISQADMDNPLVVVCYHGISSQTAAQYLCEQGFDDVYSLDGGFSAWHEANA
ncbi:thiosulfate sulfurtransferase GlpE [Shewanella sp. A25]|nr:thiosulfate sulfurtransferase GlpE [Shewanella shenzhenensis]